MAKTDKEKELESLLSEVRQEIVGLLKSEEKTLAKAHPGEDTSSEVPADTSATKPADDSSGSEASAPESAPPADASAPPADASAPAGAPPADASASAPMDGSAPAGGDPAADQTMDPAALQAEYAKLDVETLKLHYLACKEALFAAMGGAPGGGADASAAGAPPAAAPPPPAPDASAAPAGPPPGAPAPDAAPTLKGEIKPDYETTGDLSKVKEGKGLAKSEKDVEIEALKAKLSKAEATIEQVVGFVEKVVSAPTRKAVTSIADMTNGSEKKDVKSLSKAEISERLKRACEKSTMAKSDRELVTRFDLGHITVEKVAHLLG